MGEQFGFFVTVWIKISFLFTPFFALTMFLSMTDGGAYNNERRKVALQVTGAVAALSVVIFLFGDLVFNLLGITLDAFRVGAGALLFLSAVQLVQSKRSSSIPKVENDDDDIAVVPLAIPIIIGPAVIGTLMVFGSDISSLGQKGIGVAALLCAALTTGTILLLGTRIERLLGEKGLKIVSKVTGLVLSAIAAQMIMDGVKNFSQLP
jgi:multiple antibiotic resistance protein